MDPPSGLPVSAGEDAAQSRREPTGASVLTRLPLGGCGLNDREIDRNLVTYAALRRPAAAARATEQGRAGVIASPRKHELTGVSRAPYYPGSAPRRRLSLSEVGVMKSSLLTRRTVPPIGAAGRGRFALTSR